LGGWRLKAAYKAKVSDGGYFEVSISGLKPIQSIDGRQKAGGRRKAD
jgi:hypothetical protein